MEHREGPERHPSESVALASSFPGMIAILTVYSVDEIVDPCNTLKVLGSSIVLVIRIVSRRIRIYTSCDV